MDIHLIIQRSSDVKHIAPEQHPWVEREYQPPSRVFLSEELQRSVRTDTRRPLTEH